MQCVSTIEIKRANKRIISSVSPLSVIYQLLRLFFNLDQFTAKVLFHKVTFVTSGITRLHRIPYAFATQTTILGLGNLYQRFFGNGVKPVVIPLKTIEKLHAYLGFVEEAVQLVHRHRPVSRGAPLRTITEARLITRTVG